MHKNTLARERKKCWTNESYGRMKKKLLAKKSWFRNLVELV